VQNWVADMVTRGVGTATVRKRFAVLSVVLAGKKARSALRDHLILQDPCAGTDLPPERRRRVTIYRQIERVRPRRTEIRQGVETARPSEKVRGSSWWPVSWPDSCGRFPRPGESTFNRCTGPKRGSPSTRSRTRARSSW